MILLTGASGFVGKIAHPILAGRTAATGICGRNTCKGLFTPVDLARSDALATVLDAVRPDTVIHSAACRDPDACERDPANALRIHAGITAEIAAWCNRTGALLVYLSTDYVFDGTRPPYREDAPPSPLNVYGKTKAAGESAARGANQHMVVRIPLQYGYSQVPDDSMLLKIIARLKSGEPIEVDHWQYRYPTLTDDVAFALLDLIDLGFRGTIHLRAPSRLTRLEIWKAVAQALDLDPSLVRPAPEPVAQAAARPRDAALDTSLYESFRLHPFHAFTPGLEFTSKKMETAGYDWRA